jgi:hypothetical protein
MTLQLKIAETEASLLIPTEGTVCRALPDIRL